jgi:uncharacterized protein
VKLHAESIPSSNTFNAYGPGYVEVNAVRHEASIVVMPDRSVIEWPVTRFEDLTADHFAAIAALDPELVVFGSGATLRFPHPALLAPLAARRIGVETMDVYAACRTYNILMGEGRRVAAALILTPAAGV